jgi:hypothetical protein
LNAAATQVSADEFRRLFEAVRNWGRWGERAERGALNHLTPDRIAAAARLVRSGVTVTLSQPLRMEQRIDCPEPADHRMTMLTNEDIGSGTVRFAKDYVGLDYHNDGHSHIDALCHVAYDGRIYDGKPSDSITADGAEAGAISLLEVEAWDTGKAKAGLHPTAASFLAERRIAALGSDGNNDTAPSTTEGVGFPIHVLAINAMGIHLLDYLQFEDLLPRCEGARRWEFLFVAAPLRIRGGTGSPLNPIAVF